MTIETEALGELEVIDDQGAPRRLGELWARRPTLLLFVRHFG